MSVLGLRKRLKTGIKKVFGQEVSDTAAPNWQNRAPADAPPEAVPTQAAPPAAPAAEPPTVQAAPAAQADAPVPADAPAQAKASAQADAPALTEAPAQADASAQADAPTQAAPLAPTDDTAGPPLTYEAVQELLDDMVRPALQGDGGDITLLKVEEDNIYVRLVGACSTCPSAIMTMKMGVEALLREEFPTLKDLVQVDS